MVSSGFFVAGELDVWPAKDQLANILTVAGLTPVVGKYAVRVRECESWSFESVDTSQHSIAADAETLARAISDTNLVSRALARAQIRHRFEVYASDPGSNEILYYAHLEWPQEP